MPVHDPRFSAPARRREMERQEGEAERSARFEYVKPAIIGALCLPAAMTLAATRSELPVASALGSYLAV